MEEKFYEMGKILKVIRENKRYSQQEVSENTMSRSNYTKLERDEINPNVVKYLAVLDYLDMDHSEYAFILNGYTLNGKQNILYLFKEMGNFPSSSYLKALIEAAEKLLKNRKDHMVEDILNICLGYLCLIEDKDLEKARAYTAKSWKRLEKLDKFYLSEYHLLNGMLYYFEIETALHLADKALEDLDVYYCFNGAESLKFDILSNLACILIEHKYYKTALIYIERLIKDSKGYNAIHLGSAIVRRGICEEYLGKKKESQASYQLAIDLFAMIDRPDLVRKTKKKPRSVYNLYGYVDLYKFAID